jgi:hypothetical protein
MFDVRARSNTRVLLLLGLCGVAAVFSRRSIENVRDRYVSLKQFDAGTEDKSQKELTTSMAKQSETLLGWAVLALAGAATLVISTKVRPTRGLSWVFICFGPGGVLLLASSYAGLIFTRRLAAMTARNDFGDFASLNSLLGLQLQFFEYALAILSVFAAFFLYRIVEGAINPST